MDLKKVDLPNGETLTYREREGGEKRLLLVHGNMTSSKHWDVLMEKLDASFKVYAVDMRGFGGSSYHNRITSIKDFSDDIKLFVDALGLKDFALMGWSMGGTVTMQYVIDNPEDCSQLILLASGSTRGYPFYSLKPDWTPVRRLETIEEVEKDEGRTVPFSTAYQTRNHDFLKTIWNMLIYTKVQPEPDQYTVYLDDMCTQRNIADVYQALNIFNISNHHNGLTDGTNQAKDIKIPVLILRGDRDYVVTADMTNEIIADLGENARFVELVDCGHAPLIDDLDQLLHHVESFLGSTLPVNGHE